MSCVNISNAKKWHNLLISMQVQIPINKKPTTSTVTSRHVMGSHKKDIKCFRIGKVCVGLGDFFASLRSRFGRLRSDAFSRGFLPVLKLREVVPYVSTSEDYEVTKNKSPSWWRALSVSSYCCQRQLSIDHCLPIAIGMSIGIMCIQEASTSSHSFAQEQKVWWWFLRLRCVQ